MGSARDLAMVLTPDSLPPYRMGSVVGFDFNHEPPMLLVDDVDRPMRFLGKTTDYTYYDSVCWIIYNGAPLVVGRFPQMGGDLESYHIVGSGGSEPAFQNSWANFGGAHAPASFYRDPAGWVHLKGLVASGSSTATMFTLPDGYCPPFTVYFTSASNLVQCAVQVDTAGNVSKPIGGSNAYVSLNGISFPSAWNRAQWVQPVIESAWTRSTAANPTVEIFRRDDGWVWCKGIIDGTLNTRMLNLPDDTRVLFDHILHCVDVPTFAFNRVNLSYKGVLSHQVGAANVNLGGKNWFAASTSATFTAPTLLNSWANLGTTFENAGYYLDHQGRVHLQGNVTGSNTSPIFNLPVGLRPAEQQIFFAISQGEVAARVDVLANGDVQRAVGANGYLTLTGISFRAEQ